MKKLKILDHHNVGLKLDRMAYELAEQALNYSNIHWIGIYSGGYTLAGILAKKVHEIIAKPQHISKLIIDKAHIESGLPILENMPPKQDSNTCTILVDDVLESGKTMAFSLAHVLQTVHTPIISSVLVDRQHTKYPVKADVVGLSLSTTLQEKILVEWDQEKAEVFLV